MKRFVVISFIACITSPAFAGKFDKPTPELINKGKTAYTATCVACHGEKMDGNGPAGAALKPKPRNLVTEKFLQGETAKDVFNTLTTGYKANPIMTSFASMSEEDRWGIAHYIVSSRKKK